MVGGRERAMSSRQTAQYTDGCLENCSVASVLAHGNSAGEAPSVRPPSPVTHPPPLVREPPKKRYVVDTLGQKYHVTVIIVAPTPPTLSITLW
jgi:hypothetical protein